MINPQNQRITKIVELFEQTNLFTADEITLIEDYLSGTAGKEEIEKLDFRDLSAVPTDLASKIRVLGMELMNKGHDEEAGKLGDILFAAGQSSCCEMMPISNYYALEKCRTLVEEPAKKVAILAAQIGMNEYQVNRYSLAGLIKVAEGRPEVIKLAILYQRNQYENGRVVLLTVYFKAKYQNARLVAEGSADKSGGILAGVNKLLGLGESGTEPAVQIDADDALFLKAYEDVLVNNLDSLYKNQMPRLDLDEIKNAIRNDKVDERILKKARANLPVARFMLRLLGGAAFVNYAQSPCLKNVLKICFAADTAAMLDILDNMDLRGELDKVGGGLDELFGVDSRKLIAWAGAKGKTKILKRQFKRNQEFYLEYMKAADFDTFNRMNDVIKAMDPKLYKERMGQDVFRQQSKVIAAMVEIVDSQARNAVREYLNGEKGIETLYPYEDKLQGANNYRWGGKHWNILQSYQHGYGYDALSNRCEAFLMLYRGYSNTNSLRIDNEIKDADVKRLFAAVDAEKLSLKHQLNGYMDAYESFYLDKWKEQFQKAAMDVFLGYLEERREEMVPAFQEAGSTGRCLGIQALSRHPGENKEVLLAYAQDSSKAVREELLNVLYREKGWEEDVLKLLSSKKAAEREIAIRVLSKWDSEKYAPVLTESLEKEKNGKVRTLLETVLHVSGGESAGGRALTQEDLVKELHKGGKKRSLAWAYETPFSVVHKKDGEEASEEYLQAVFLSYSTMSPCGVSPTAATLAKALDEKELAIYVNELFDKWMEAGAESKKRWVLYAASIHGGEDIVKKLHHQIQEWPQAARGAIASEAVQALALSPQPQALLIVDGISRKFKFKQIKAAAGKALEFAAAQLNITTEELADRIVPDMGFNENMERMFDYGERKFTVTITTALEIEVFDENGKKLKNLPAPGKRDDEEKAAAAYEEFKQMKKQMKATVTSQKMRLEMALSTGRQWSVAAWKNLFVKNPVMHQFATGLIWGVYEDRKLVSTFRYMEDGSFNTEDEDEFELPEETGAQSASAQAVGQQISGQLDAAGQGAVAEGAEAAAEGAGPMEEGAEPAAEGARPMAEGAESAAEGAAPGAEGTGPAALAPQAGQRKYIGLVHPIELSADSVKAWKEQLEDYEITQPIEQLDRSVYYMTKEEENQKSLERFGGCILNDLSLGGKLQTLGWYRGSVQDAGGFYSYYREDKELGLGVELHFSGSFVGGGNEDVTVYEARFYSTGGVVLAENGGTMVTGGIRRGSYVYDEADDSNSCFLKDVPERYFSEIVLQLAKATASSKEKDANWKAKK
ncbi:DUF4132 domain-containing protein [uncultured Acetatifactor sp.]|uniref:DUF4132 domain-containing protein n=1 Tax=uncultured Acetatifactor sp. TaxID=1671927 RepID=UPI002630FD7E|nr:DUF4132 domain-containing protein [uncultured Acetatifactor sp.]